MPRPVTVATVPSGSRRSATSTRRRWPPVAAGGRIYITSREGTTVVIADGPRVNVLATNVLEDGFDASAAVVGDAIYMRGREFLYCIASD